MTRGVEALDFEFQVQWHVLSLPTSSLVLSVWLNCSGKEPTSVPPSLTWIQPHSRLRALHVQFPLSGHPSPGHPSSWIPAICSCVSFSPSSCWAQSCLTLCDLMDCSPPGSSVHGISQARILEWVAISFSRGSRIEPISPSLAGRFLTTEPAAAAAAKSLQSCLTLYDPRDGSPPLPSLGFSRQEHWSGLPFPSPNHESKKWKWSRSVVSDPQRSHGLQPSRLLHPWDFPGRSTRVGCHCLLRLSQLGNPIISFRNTSLETLQLLPLSLPCLVLLHTTISYWYFT